MVSGRSEVAQAKINDAPGMVLLAVGLLLLLWNLGGAPLNNDEASHSARAVASWDRIFEILRQDNYPPLYFVYMKFWGSVFGIGQWALRLSSLPSAWACMIVFWLWMRQVLPPVEARTALALFVFSPFLLFLIRQAKYFPHMILFALLAMWMFWILVEKADPLRRRLGAILVWGLSALALIWIHYLGALVWAGMGLWLVAGGIIRRDKRSWMLLGILVLFFIGYVPQIGLLFDQLTRKDELGSQTLPSPLRRIVVHSVYTLWTFCIGHTVELSRFVLGGIGVGIPVVVLALSFWRKERTPFACYALFMGAIILFGSYAIVYTAQPTLPDLAVPERLILALPFGIALFARGLWLLPSKWRTLLAALYAIPVAWSILSMYTLRENNSWENLIPWDEIKAEVISEGSPYVVVDSWHMGSRGWYYFRDDAAVMIQLRNAYEEGTLEEQLGDLPGGRPIYYIRSVRDSSPALHVTRATEVLEERFGPPCESWSYIQDSDSMRRLKSIVRRGTGVAETASKVQLLKFCPNKSTNENLHNP